jgi:hypothetical protein
MSVFGGDYDDDLLSDSASEGGIDSVAAEGVPVPILETVTMKVLVHGASQYRMPGVGSDGGGWKGLLDSAVVDFLMSSEVVHELAERFTNVEQMLSQVIAVIFPRYEICTYLIG